MADERVERSRVADGVEVFIDGTFLLLCLVFSSAAPDARWM